MEALTVAGWHLAAAPSGPALPRVPEGIALPAAIWVDGKTSAIAQEPLRPYTAMAIQALDSLDLGHATVLDLGCADGILSLIAMKKGAESVCGVDKAQSAEAAYRNTMRRNGIPDARARFISQDITDTLGLKEKLPRRFDVVIANIGPHYGRADIAAIELLPHVGAQVFIGGGYTQDGPSYNPRAARRALAAVGFSGGYREFVAPLHEDLPRMAFVMWKSG